MKKRIKIWKGKLEIEQTGLGYMVCNKELSFFVHSDKLGFIEQYNKKHIWLQMFDSNNNYIGSIWINTDTDMRKIEKFLEETKNERPKENKKRN